ncbi:hypothetical protein [Cylindrospermum stagnale]|nr:hypothetical protein [Cylindrospermum stagnale]
MINSEAESILAVFPGQKVESSEGADKLPILGGIALELTVKGVSGWLNFD